MGKRTLVALIAAIAMTALAATAAAVPDKAGVAGRTAANDLRIGYPTAPVSTLDPAKIAVLQGGNFGSLIFESLVRLDTQGDPQPFLATSWSLSRDRLVWTFQLRRNVRFHDGTAFNAEAVKYTLERVLDPATASPLGGSLSAIDTVTAVRSHTVAIRTKRPYAPLLSALSYVPAFIVSPNAAREAGLSGFGLRPVGTGPYQVTTFSTTGNISLVRNPRYWGARPKLNSINVQFFQEESTLVSSLLAGNTHVGWLLSPAQLPVLRASSRVKAVVGTGYTIAYLGFNTNKPPFNRPVVRQAVAHAIDLDAILKNVLQGGGLKTAGPMGPAVFGFNPKHKPHVYDPARARKILSDVGISNLEIKLYIPIDATRERIATVMQQQLKLAGIDLNIVVQPFGAFLADVTAGKEDMFALQWSNGTGDADFTFNAFQTGSPVNFTRISNPALDRLIAKQKTQFDPKERIKTIWQALNVIKQQTPWVPTYTVRYIIGVGDSVSGFRPVPGGYFDQMLSNVTVKG